MRKALIVLDMINDIVHPEGKIPSCAAYVLENNVIQKINTLISKFRRAHLPIIFVNIAFEADYSDCIDPSPMLSTIRERKALNIATWGTDLVAGLAVDKNDKIVLKKNISAFSSNEFLRELNEKNISAMTVVGVSMNNAVKQTLIEARAKNFWVSVVPECCGASDSVVYENTLNSLIKDSFNIETQGGNK